MWLTGRVAAVFSLAALAPGESQKRRKPLFESDDHYVMLNDDWRNSFYRRALARALPECGKDCFVLDVGAGSGLLSMIAASLGAPQVLAIEANKDLAALAIDTVAQNRPLNFPTSNVTIVAELSSKVHPDVLPGGRKADLLVTETFGTMLMGEGANNFVPDARDRLLKEGGKIVPSGGCQMATLVESHELASVTSATNWGGFDLSRLNILRDTVYWKMTMGHTKVQFTALSERVCVLGFNIYKDYRSTVPDNQTFRIQATRPGTVHAILFDWDVWADDTKADNMSTAPGTREFAGDVAWGYLLQLQEAQNEDWSYEPFPRFLEVKKGDELDLGVEYIAAGISMHAKIRPAPAAGSTHAAAPPTSVGTPKRLLGKKRSDIVESNEYHLPLAGDGERNAFYEGALSFALAQNRTKNANPTVLDCTGGAGIAALLAAKKHGLESMLLSPNQEYVRAFKEVIEANKLEDKVQAYAAPPSLFMESLLPQGERMDVVVLDIPGTPLHGNSPFSVLADVRKQILKPNGAVVPSGACFEVGLVESLELAQMFSVPSGTRWSPSSSGKWTDIELEIWNTEARKRSVFNQLVPYTKWFGAGSNMTWRWLTPPLCAFEVDFQTYGFKDAPPEEVKESVLALNPAKFAGRGHAVVAQWVVWASPDTRRATLSPDSESGYFGRGLTWPHYAQALAVPTPNNEGPLEAPRLEAGEVKHLKVVVRQGKGKQMYHPGPEFELTLLPPEWEKSTEL